MVLVGKMNGDRFESVAVESTGIGKFDLMIEKGRQYC